MKMLRYLSWAIFIGAIMLAYGCELRRHPKAVLPFPDIAYLEHKGKLSLVRVLSLENVPIRDVAQDVPIKFAGSDIFDISQFKITHYQNGGFWRNDLGQVFCGFLIQQSPRLYKLVWGLGASNQKIEIAGSSVSAVREQYGNPDIFGSSGTVYGRQIRYFSIMNKSPFTHDHRPVSCQPLLASKVGRHSSGDEGKHYEAENPIIKGVFGSAIGALLVAGALWHGMFIAPRHSSLYLLGSAVALLTGFLLMVFSALVTDWPYTSLRMIFNHL